MNTKLTIRGDAQRKRFLGQNNIECIAHLVLLPRQMIKCCCNNDITSDYINHYLQKVRKILFRLDRVVEKGLLN